MKGKFNIMFFIFLLMSISIKVFAQGGGIHKVGTTSFQFLKVMPDARSTAMGEAYVAVANNSEAVFWNPAALSKVPGFDISLSHLDWLLDMTHQSFAFAYTLSGLGTIGLQAIVTNVGDIQETRVDHLYRDENTGKYNPGLTGGTVSPGAQVFGISFARYMTDKFGLGLTAKYAMEDLVAKSASAIIFDAGLTYRTGFRSLELAAVIRHFGPEIKYIAESYPLPQTLSIGVSSYLFAPGNSLFFQSNNHQLLIAYDMVEARDYGQQYQVGLEYSIKKMLFLRGGYKINYDEEGLTLGFGLKALHTRVDYSYASFGETLKPVHRFTVGFDYEKH